MKQIFFLLHICLSTAVFAQNGLHLQFLPQHNASAAYQPANLLLQDFETFSVGADGALWINNTSITLDALFQSNNIISEDLKLQMIDQLGTENQFQQGYHINFGEVHFKLGKQRYSLSYRDRSGFFLRFGNPLTAGLIFRGNAPYAGQTITDENTALRQYRMSEGAIGTGFEIGKVKIGVRAKFLYGRNVTAIDHLSYSLTTAALGDVLSLTSDHDIYLLENNPSPAGLGAGLDLGAIYDLNDKWQLQVSLTDLGAVSWDTERYQHQVSFDFEGFDLRELIDANGSGQDFFVTDTLRSLLFPTSESSRYMMSLPTTLTVGVKHPLSEKARLMGSLSYGLTGQAPSTRSPLLNVAYHRDFTKHITLGANAYGGGMDLFGVGLFGEANVSLKDYQLRIFALADNLVGGVLSDVGRGVSAQAGISIAR